MHTQSKQRKGKRNFFRESKCFINNRRPLSIQGGKGGGENQLVDFAVDVIWSIELIEKCWSVGMTLFPEDKLGSKSTANELF